MFFFKNYIVNKAKVFIYKNFVIKYIPYETTKKSQKTC